MKEAVIAYDMDGYELIPGDYVVCMKRLYRINKLIKNDVSKRGIINTPCCVLELMHVKTTKIVKKKDFEVERLN